MGCTSSKTIEDTAVDTHRPSPASFSIFDVYAIEEPWLNAPDTDDDHKKPSHVPPTILEKLKAIEEAPCTWDEVSKVLEDLKPKLTAPPPPQVKETPSAAPRAAPLRRKSFSFHTLEELEARVNSSKTTKTEPKFQFERSHTVKTDSRNGVISSGVPISLKDNMFIVRDKVERRREGKSPVARH